MTKEEELEQSFSDLQDKLNSLVMLVRDTLHDYQACLYEAAGMTREQQVKVIVRKALGEVE